MIRVTRLEAPDCGDCRGAGLVRPGVGRAGWVTCEGCRGTGKARPAAPYSVDWVRGEEDGGELECRFLAAGLPDREAAVARALRLVRDGLGAEFAGGAVVVSDARGVRTFEAHVPAEAYLP